ncbi:bifunctional aminoglycoside phosphotransferase/ATP-binding protein [Poseidonocella sp. HB161398]|uniref:bifunctional aminoglycoside phosphotransferase/ATP-binding protein n=1 Tax=Poseidonocella sp. HB161398 TaxID=2320855 RepID=UPI0011092E47|nr:bifunctional aminoglycoside phosphotransferase/ATP-binding protein [Poseidonocella sp. HB161398]
MRVEDQSDTRKFLCDPRTHGGAGPVELVETHISAVFLAGRRAYKLKQAVRLPYADFSTPGIRLAACEKELELNRATAPELYLGVRRITREPGGPAFDGPGPLIDAVVEMERFEQDSLFDRMAQAGRLDAPLIRALAAEIAAAHDAARPLPDEPGAANIEGVLDINRAGFGESDVFAEDEIEAIDSAFRSRLGTLAPLLDKRARAGFIRRCHGDLHLRNICLWQGRPRLFDCIDFNDRLAIIDLLYDLAFMAMDLWHRGRKDFANLLVNRYLDRTGQEEGFALMPFFTALRAAVRAHVTATQAASGRPGLAEEARSYYRLAMACLAPEPARLVAIGGLSGSGKSTVASALAPHLGAPPGARLVESDLARKAMFGVEPETRLPPEAYRPDVSDRVYAAMADRSQALLRQGAVVVADAVYDRPERRAGIAAAAEAAGVPFTGLWLDVAPQILRDRVAARRDSVSDATGDVLEAQLARGTGEIRWRHVDGTCPAGEQAGALAAELQPEEG